MRVLITRPGDDGQQLVDALDALGVEPVLEPLLTIHYLDGPPLDLEGVQAILITSANGARALARRTETRDLSVYAVGDASARAAREAGFTAVESAEGDVHALADLVRARLDPAAGSLVHVAGAEVAGDLAGSLGEQGFTCRREALYEAETVRALSTSAIAAIKENRIDAVMLFSPRTAETFAGLVRKARLVRDCRTIELVCLSQAVADAAEDIAWKRVHVAERPTQEAMVQLVAALAQAETSAVQTASESAEIDRDTAQSLAAAPIQRRETRTARTVVLTLLAVAIVAGGAAASFPLWRPYVADYLPQVAAAPDDSRIESLAERLAALEKKSDNLPPEISAMQEERERLQTRLNETFARIERLEAALESVRETVSAVKGDDAAAAREALERVNERLREVEQARSDTNATQTERLDRLARQIEEIEKNMPAPQDAAVVQSARVVFAIGRLRDAVQSSQSFTMELAALRSVAGNDPGIAQAIDRLQPHADTGVPTEEALRARFKDIANTLVNASREPAGDGWMERTLARVMQAVNWRRTDVVSGASPDAVVARAERAIAQRDLRRAVGELKTLPETAMPAARPWIQDAEAHLAASRALIDLQTKAFTELGVTRPSP